MLLSLRCSSRGGKMLSRFLQTIGMTQTKFARLRNVSASCISASTHVGVAESASYRFLIDECGIDLMLFDDENSVDITFARTTLLGMLEKNRQSIHITRVEHHETRIILN
jgi:hypothetical protein